MCAVSFALHILFVGRYSPVSDYRQLFILQLALSAGMAAVATPIVETPFLVWDVLFSIYLLITGVLATALGFYIQNRAQRLTTANRTALIFSLEPIFAVHVRLSITGSGPHEERVAGRKPGAGGDSDLGDETRIDSRPQGPKTLKPLSYGS